MDTELLNPHWKPVGKGDEKHMAAAKPETDGDTTPPFLVGPRIILRSLQPEDAQGPYLHWLNDADVCRGNAHHVYPYGPEAAVAYIRASIETQQHLILAIVLRKDGRHIGNIALQDIHPINRAANFAVLIGDKKAWGKGFGREAGRLLFNHGFSSLNLRRIACGTLEDNAAMRSLALSLGMKQEGRRRQSVFKRGRYVDMIEYGVLRSEYETPFGKKK
jgi:[ribosomal protein S5]-alanine N-acetyltransferase